MKGVLFVRNDKELLSNKIFSGASLYGMKSDNYMYIHLRQTLAQKGITLDTQDVVVPEEADFIICLNETNYFQTYQRSLKNKFIFLILSEPPVYNYIDWQKNYHKPFDKVFTYDSDLVDNKKYFHYNFPIDFSFNYRQPNSAEEFRGKKHCIIVAGAISTIPHASQLKSLLYERFKAIKWFNKNEPVDLDFFARTHPIIHCGIYKGARLMKHYLPGIHKMVAMRKFKNNMGNVFRGAIPADDKIEFVSNYKFSLCYENTHGIKGLISEKIFDCFMALNVPIYYGAPDISAYVPKDCFIQFEDFNSYKELSTYLKSIDVNTYRLKQEAILDFMTSEKIKPFSLDTYSNIFLNHIKKNR